jgi:hypothetical protein
VEQQESYRSLTNAKDQTEMKEAAFEAWMAYVLIAKSDQAKYGTLNKGFVSQFSLGNDQYPKTIQTAVDVLSNHRLDPKYYENREKQRKQRALERAQQRETTEAPATSFAQCQTGDLTCYCCRKKGHIAPNCEKRYTTPRSEWHVNRAMSHMQDGADDTSKVTYENQPDHDSQSVRSTPSTSSRGRRSGPTNNQSRQRDQTPGPSRDQNSNVGWSSFQRQEFCSFQEAAIVNNQGAKFSNLNDVILLDSGSTLGATFMNPDMVHDVKVTKMPISMATNAGTKRINLKARVPGLRGHAWYDPDQLANIFGLSHLAEQYRITFDSDKEDAFLVHTEDGPIKFNRTPEGLYAYKPTEKFFETVADKKAMEPPMTSSSNLIATVSENRKGYTQRQFENAKKARNLYHAVGCPTVENFKHII